MSLVPLLALMSIPGPSDNGEDPFAPPGPTPAEAFVLYFIVGSAALSEIAQAQLDQAAHRMNQDPTLTANIVGYGPADGLAVAEERAVAVRNYLVAHHGIDPGRLQHQGQVASASPRDQEATLTLLAY